VRGVFWMPVGGVAELRPNPHPYRRRVESQRKTLRHPGENQIKRALFRAPTKARPKSPTDKLGQNKGKRTHRSEDRPLQRQRRGE
jgi:hypothetical protein